MESSQIERVLDGMDISGTTLIQVPELRTIILTTNQGIRYNEDIITFDLPNSLTKIKSYTCKGISGRFSNKWIKTDSGIIFKTGVYENSLLNKWYPFRKPKIGDIIFIVKQDDSVSSETTRITRITNDEVEFEDSIEFNNGDIICYADSREYNNHPVSDPLDPSLLLIKNPMSNHQYDLYLDSNQIVGFETVMGRIANS